MDNNTEGDKSKLVEYSRRDFLRQLSLTGAGLATRKADRALSLLRPSENEPVELILPGFKKIEFPTLPFRRDSMLVKGSDRPLSGKEIEQYFTEQSTEKKPPFNVLSSEIIVGSEAWSRWNHGQSRSDLNHKPPANGKHMLHYLKEHFVTIPQMVIDRTRAEACIRHIRMETDKHPTRVIIVDEDWLRDNSQYGYGSITSWIHSPSVHARYNFPASYEPSSSAYYQLHDGKDKGLLHEGTHFSMGLLPHLSNYFTMNANWRTNLLLPPGITHDQIRLWQENAMQQEMFSGQLLRSIPVTSKGESYLSRPEEFVINRQINHGSFDNKSLDFSSKGEGSSDFAPIYSVHPPDLNTAHANLYIARLQNINSPGDNFVWDFREQGHPLDILPSGMPLPMDLIKGGIVDADGNETGLAKAFLLKVDNKAYAFTSHHLAFWHYREQAGSQQPYIGKYGPQKAVTMALGDF